MCPFLRRRWKTANLRNLKSTTNECSGSLWSSVSWRFAWPGGDDDDETTWRQNCENDVIESVMTMSTMTYNDINLQVFRVARQATSFWTRGAFCFGKLPVQNLIDLLKGEIEGLHHWWKGKECHSHIHVTCSETSGIFSPILEGETLCCRVRSFSRPGNQGENDGGFSGFPCFCCWFQPWKNS